MLQRLQYEGQACLRPWFERHRAKSQASEPRNILITTGNIKTLLVIELSALEQHPLFSALAQPGTVFEVRREDFRASELASNSCNVSKPLTIIYGATQSSRILCQHLNLFPRHDDRSSCNEARLRLQAEVLVDIVGYAGSDVLPVLARDKNIRIHIIPAV